MVEAAWRVSTLVETQEPCFLLLFLGAGAPTLSPLALCGILVAAT